MYIGSLAYWSRIPRNERGISHSHNRKDTNPNQNTQAPRNVIFREPYMIIKPLPIAPNAHKPTRTSLPIYISQDHETPFVRTILLKNATDARCVPIQLDIRGRRDRDEANATGTRKECIDEFAGIANGTVFPRRVVERLRVSVESGGMIAQRCPKA